MNSDLSNPSSKSSNDKLPIIALLLAALCYTSLVVGNKWLSDQGVSAFQQIFWRVALGTVYSVFGAILFEKKNFQINSKELKYILINALLFLGGFSTFTLAISLGTPIAKAVALNYAYPLVIVLVNFLIFKELPNFKHFFSTALSLLSVALIVDVWKVGSWDQFKLGEFIALSNAAFYGSIIVFSKVIQKVLPGSLYRTLFYSHLLMLPMFVVLGLLLNTLGSTILVPDFNLNLGLNNWIILLVSSLTGGIMPLALIYFGVSKIKPYLASLLLLTEPIWVYLCGLIFFDQQLSLTSMLGMFGILLSVFLI